MKRRIGIGRFSIPTSALSGAVLMLMIGYYYALISVFFREGPFHIGPGGLTFNSMLDHFLHGRFDVDAAIIGDEGFVHDGRTYAYFGILPSFFRLPLLLFGQLNTLDLTMVSCVIGAAVAAYLKIRAATVAALQCDKVPIRGHTFFALLTVFFIGGPEVQMSRPSIYQEVLFWDDALAAGFIYYVVLGLVVRHDFDARILGAMATLAGLTLITRVSTAIGMYAATGLLVVSGVWTAMGSYSSRSATLQSSVQRCATVARSLTSLRTTVPIGILACFATLCGIINFERWGNPLVFAPLQENILYSKIYPGRTEIINSYGVFNVERVWYGFLYYFLPIWSWIRPDGKFMFYEFQHRTINMVEMPPSSFLISDPLLIALTICFFALVVSPKNSVSFDVRSGAMVLLGLAIPALLIMGWETIAYRYRIEFHPFLSLSAILGLCLLCSPAGGKMRFSRGLGVTFLGLAAVGVLISHVLYALYALSNLGPSDVVMKTGWAGFYRYKIERALKADAGASVAGPKARP